MRSSAISSGSRDMALRIDIRGDSRRVTELRRTAISLGLLACSSPASADFSFTDLVPGAFGSIGSYGNYRAHGFDVLRRDASDPSNPAPLPVKVIDRSRFTNEGPEAAGVSVAYDINRKWEVEFNYLLGDGFGGSLLSGHAIASGFDSQGNYVPGKTLPYKAGLKLRTDSYGFSAIRFWPVAPYAKSFDIRHLFVAGRVGLLAINTNMETALQLGDVVNTSETLNDGQCHSRAADLDIDRAVCGPVIHHTAFSVVPVAGVGVWFKIDREFRLGIEYQRTGNFGNDATGRYFYQAVYAYLSINFFGKSGDAED